MSRFARRTAFSILFRTADGTVPHSHGFNGWTFDIYELTEAGDIVHERLAYPSKRRGNEPPKEGELVEGTWQYDAAMTSIPPVARPKPQFDNDASLQFGLDFFLAGVFGMVMILSAGFLFAPPKRTE